MTNEARVWNRLAGRYDTVVRVFDTSYPKVKERLATDLPRGGRILEVAAGTGQFTVELAGIAGSLLATDVSPKMVEALRQSIADARAPNVELGVMSAGDIRASDGHFDAVFCANALHVMDEPEGALEEFRRVLRPGGVLVAPTFLHGVDIGRRTLSRALSVVSPFVANNRFNLAQLQTLIEAAGFDVVHAERMPGVFPLGYVVAQRPGGVPSDRPSAADGDR